MTTTDKQARAALLRKIEKSDGIAKRCVLFVDDCQTADEQMERQTHHRNGIGFSVFDAEFGGSLADQIRCDKELSPKQMLHVRRLAVKYSGQVIQDDRIARVLLQNNN